MMQLNTVGLLVIKDRALLLAYSNNKQCFYLPGGKIDAGETAIAALCREIREELDADIDPGQLEYITHITAPAFGESAGIIMEQDCYLLAGDIDPHPTAEIGELRYFTLQQYLQQPQQAPGAIMILQLLQAKDMID